jgi:uncharacterized membrane protein
LSRRSFALRAVALSYKGFYENVQLPGTDLYAIDHKRIVLVLRSELVLLLAMAACASLMARGVGM